MPGLLMSQYMMILKIIKNLMACESYINLFKKRISGDSGYNILVKSN